MKLITYILEKTIQKIKTICNKSTIVKNSIEKEFKATDKIIFTVENIVSKGENYRITIEKL
jgi:hypothetical protein